MRAYRERVGRIGNYRILFIIEWLRLTLSPKGMHTPPWPSTDDFLPHRKQAIAWNRKHHRWLLRNAVEDNAEKCGSEQLLAASRRSLDSRQSPWHAFSIPFLVPYYRKIVNLAVISANRTDLIHVSVAITCAPWTASSGWWVSNTRVLACWVQWRLSMNQQISLVQPLRVVGFLRWYPLQVHIPLVSQFVCWRLSDTINLCIPREYVVPSLAAAII